MRASPRYRRTDATEPSRNYPAGPTGTVGRRLLLLMCLVLAGALAPSALAQPSIPDLPGDVDDRVPDDVTDRLPDGNDGEGEDDETGCPRCPTFRR